MPKITRDRQKHHTASASAGSRKPALALDWQNVNRKSAKGKSASKDDIEVDDADLVGLDVEKSANESEESKRSALADALKDLIAMGEDDEDEDDEDEDEDDEMDDEIAAKMPMKGTLFSKAKPSSVSAVAAASATTKLPSKNSSSSAATAAAPPAKLNFAPSLPSRAQIAVAAAKLAASKQDDEVDPVNPGKKVTKLEKRQARHSKLMGRLGLPGTGVFGREAQKKLPGGAFSTLSLLNTELSTTLLSPAEQYKQTLAARRALAAHDARKDVLFLNDSEEQNRIKGLKEQIAAAKAVKTQKQPATSNGPKKSAGGDMDLDMAASASAPAAHNVPSSAPSAPHTSSSAAPSTPSPFEAHKNLSAAARRKMARQELAHFSAVLHHPQFQASPLGALQRHIENTNQLAALQREADKLQNPFQHHQESHAKKNVSGSQKKKNKKAAEHREHVLQQMRK